MKKVVMIVCIVLLGIAGLYWGLRYHARMTASDWGGMENPDVQIGKDGEHSVPDKNVSDNMLDGDFTYVDNEKLLRRIVGNWASEDGSYHMRYDNEYQMTIVRDGANVLVTKADFSYLQPGEVVHTDFMLESSVIQDVAGKDWGEVEYCYHFLDGEEDVICMGVYIWNTDKMPNDTNDTIVIQFKKE